MLVPMRFRSLLVASARAADPQTKEDGAIIPHRPVVMRLAMEPNLPSVEDAVLIYRACFDKLFAHLTEANRLLDTGQVRRKDLNALHYWLERIMRYQYPPPGCAPEEMFQPFLRAFGYTELFKLLDRIDVPR